jgi:hypothetical protein
MDAMRRSIGPDLAHSISTCTAHLRTACKALTAKCRFTSLGLTNGGCRPVELLGPCPNDLATPNRSPVWLVDGDRIKWSAQPASQYRAR